MDTTQIEYYIEKVDGARLNFNLWEKEGARYYNVASLFFNDPMCGTQWTVTPKQKAVNYGDGEIRDELESPLVKIPTERAEQMLKLGTAHEAAKSIEDFLR